MKTKKGLTLIELLVVLFIISLLTTLVTINTQGSRVKARDNRRIADLKTIQGALEIFFADNKKYPTSIYDDGIVGGDDDLFRPFLNPVPKDPKAQDGYCYSWRVDTSSAWQQGGATSTNGIDCPATGAPLGFGAGLTYRLISILEKSNPEALNDLSPTYDKRYDIGG